MSINHSATQILDQLKSVIEQFSDADYRKPLAILGHSSIGQHVRHTLEFFICLMDAKNQGIINYDKRRHDKLIETDVSLSLSVIKSIDEFLEKEINDFTLQLEANYQLNDTSPITISSNFFRELAYNIEHAIHHMALIKIGIKSDFSNIKLPDHFGVASSTVRYQKSQ